MQLKIPKIHFAIIAGVVVLCSARDWTCEECVEGGQAIADFLTTPDNIVEETNILIQEVCPQHPDPYQCTQVTIANMVSMLSPQCNVLDHASVVGNCGPCHLRRVLA